MSMEGDYGTLTTTGSWMAFAGTVALLLREGMKWWQKRDFEPNYPLLAELGEGQKELKVALEALRATQIHQGKRLKHAAQRVAQLHDNAGLETPPKLT